jgi:hypothetical protein
MEVAYDKLNDSSEALLNIGRFLNELTLKTDERTKSLNRLSGSSESVRIRESKRVIDKSAEDIMNFVSRTRLEIAIYKDLFESGFNALVNAYSIWKAYFKDSEELSKAKESVLQLKGITLNTINLVVIYRVFWFHFLI